MTTFRYQAIEAAGSSVQGIIEAEDRRNALQQLKHRGLVPASLEAIAAPLSSPSTAAKTSSGTAPGNHSPYAVNRQDLC